MAILNLQIQYNAKSPITSGDKRRIGLQLAKLLFGMTHGTLPGLSAGQNYIQYQQTAVAATGTVTAAAVQSGDTVTLGGTALTAAQKRATGTITCATAIAGNTITVNGQVFTGTAGAVVLGEATFSIDTGDNATAASIVAQVNAYAGSKVNGVVAAKASAAVVTIYAVNEGTSGNAYTLASSGSTLAVSGATLANGAAASNNTFDFAGSNTTTAASLAAAIYNSTTAAVALNTATSANAVVTITAKVAGLSGNATTLASSNGGRLAVSAATLTGGSVDAPVRLRF